jgi:transposase-like protein
MGYCWTAPSFLKETVERVLLELLEAEMTEYVGAAPLRAHHRAQRAPQRPQDANPKDAGVGTLNLLVPHGTLLMTD